MVTTTVKSNSFDPTKLEPFAKQLGTHGRVAARRFEDGDIVLYTRHRGGLGQRLADKLSGRTDEARKLAKDTIAGMLQNLRETIVKERGDKALIRGIDDLLKRLPNGSHDLKGQLLSDIVKGAAQVHQKHQDAIDAFAANDLRLKNERDNARPRATSTPIPAVPLKHRESALIDPGRNEVDALFAKDKTLCKKLGALPAGKDNAAESERKKVAQDLGDHLASWLRDSAKFPDSDKKIRDKKNRDLEMSFATAPEKAEAFKAALVQAAAPGAKHEQLKQIRQVIDAAYAHAMTQLTDKIDDKTGEIEIAGKRYVKERTIGEGGFGRADLYACETVDPTGHKRKDYIVIKAPLDDIVKKHGARARELACREVRAHRSAERDGHECVVGLRGAIPTSNGQVLIPLEYLPGSVMDIADAVRSLGLPDRVRHAVLLTLMKDSVAGANHMHQEGGVIHRDLKPYNTFVGHDGIAKQGDYGASALGLKQLWSKSDMVENPIYLPPEVLLKNEELRKAASEAKKQAKDDFKTLNKDLGVKPTGEEQDAWSELVNQKSDAVTVELADGEHADVWSLGVGLHQIFFGKLPFGEGEGFMSKIEKEILDFGKDPSNHVRPVGNSKDGKKDDVSSAVDRLMNGMLAPVDSQRFNLAQALGSSAFEAPDVGGEEAREIISVLAGACEEAAQRAAQAKANRKAAFAAADPGAVSALEAQWKTKVDEASKVVVSLRAEAEIRAAAKRMEAGSSSAKPA